MTYLTILSFLKSIIWPWVKKAVVFLITAPGIYLLLLVLVSGSWWISGEIGYSRGYTQAQKDNSAKEKEREIAEGKNIAFVQGKTEEKISANQKVNVKNIEVIKYVRVKAGQLPDGSIVCIPSDVADKLRGIE